MVLPLQHFGKFLPSFTIAWVSLDNRIYATIGGEQRATYFLRYDPSTNTWSDAEVADPPAGMGDGASLVWSGGEFLHALRGEFYEESPTYDFWGYNITSDVWTAMADIPAYPHDGGVGGVGDGGCLLYVGLWLSDQTDFIYALSGNQAYPESPSPIPDNRFYRYTISTEISESQRTFLILAQTDLYPFIPHHQVWVLLTVFNAVNTN